MGDLFVIAGSIALSAGIAIGTWLVWPLFSQMNWISRLRGSRVPEPILVAGIVLYFLLLLSAYFLLLLLVPLYLIVAIGYDISRVGSAIGGLICVYSFGASAWAMRSLTHPDIESSSQRSELRAPLVLFSSTFLAALCLGGLGAAFAVLRILSFTYPKEMNAPARSSPDGLCFTLVLVLACVVAILAGAYFGYRAWKAAASRFLSSDDIRIIAFGGSRSIAKALENATGDRAAG